MDRARYKLGAKIRRDIFGADYAKQQTAKIDPALQPWQDYVHEFVWGGIWGRPGLPRKTRSMLNLAMLAVLNMNHELKLHMRAAFKNGVSKQEIVEVLLQAAMYGGAPVGSQAFSAAREVFAQREPTTVSRRAKARGRRR
jgi:4-carboxymuconolactone decarboxylase